MVFNTDYVVERFALVARWEEFPPEVRDEALDDSRVLKINGLLKHNI